MAPVMRSLGVTKPRGVIGTALKVLPLLLVGSPLVHAQTSFPGDKERERICKELVRRSSLVLVAIPASEPDEIVDRAKLKAALAPGHGPKTLKMVKKVIRADSHAK